MRGAGIRHIRAMKAKRGRSNTRVFFFRIYNTVNVLKFQTDNKSERICFTTLASHRVHEYFLSKAIENKTKSGST